MDYPHPVHCPEHINTRQLMFLQLPVPFLTFYIFVTSWFGKADSEFHDQNAQNFHPFFHDRQKIEDMSPGDMRGKKLPTENKQRLKLFDFHRISIVMRHLSSLKYGRSFSVEVFTDSDRIKITVHNYHKLADVPR